MLCALVDVYWHFRRTYGLSHQGQRVFQVSYRKAISTGTGSLLAPFLTSMVDAERFFKTSENLFSLHGIISGDSTLCGSCHKNLKLNV
jgi:hypothetical protein